MYVIRCTKKTRFHYITRAYGIMYLLEIEGYTIFLNIKFQWSIDPNISKVCKG